MATNTETERERTTSGDLRPDETVGGGAGKPYIAPRLERYGDVRAITNAVGNMGNNDTGGSGSMKRTAL